MVLQRQLRQHPLCLRAIDHGGKLRAFGTVGRQGVYLVDKPLFVGARKCLVAERTLRAFLHPTGIRIGAEMHVWVIKCLILGEILRCLDMGTGLGGTLDQRRVDNRRLSLFQLQTMCLDLGTDLGQKVVINTSRHKRIAKPAMGGLIRNQRVQVAPAEDHEIQTNFQSAFQLWVG